jgi:Domain of unknown function (DUF4402)
MKKFRAGIIKYIILLLAIAFTTDVKAQDPTDSLPGDPGAIYVYTYQNLSFGSFAQSGAGTVIVSNSGGRSATGGIILINGGASFFQSIFDVEAAPGSLISITNGPNATLTGSNGGTLTLVIGNSDPGSPFSTTVSPPARTAVNIGGTLTVPAASPKGIYTGTFYVTFNQE